MRISEASLQPKQIDCDSRMPVHNTESIVYIFGHRIFHSDLQSIHQQQNRSNGLGEHIALACLGPLPLLSGDYSKKVKFGTEHRFFYLWILFTSKLHFFLLHGKQAASLTYACESAQSSGHQVRIKPYVHYNTSLEELNSILLYASSLRMSAKLCRMPIHGSYVFFIILCIVVSTITFGMCLNVSLGIIQT